MNAFFNDLGALIVNSISFIGREISHKYTFFTYYIKLAKIVLIVVINVACASKQFEVRYVWCLSLEQLLWSLPQHWSYQTSFEDVVSSIYNLCLIFWEIIVRDHGSCHVFKSSIFPFIYSILLKFLQLRSCEMFHVSHNIE